jgi:hypothetical protein
MLRQCKVAVKFHSPVLGIDMHDGEEILSDKHWVIAEVMKLESGCVIFESYDQKVLASWLAEDIDTIRHNVLDADSPVITAQKSFDYQREVINQRPAAWSKWTPVEEQQLLERLSAGFNINELADIHQRTKRAICERLNLLGVSNLDWEHIGVRPEKRHYEELGVNGKPSYQSKELMTICLGCGYQIESRPCKCWTSVDTSTIRLWREHKYKYGMYGNIIGQNY